MADGWFSLNFPCWLCCRGCFLGENVLSQLPRGLLEVSSIVAGREKGIPPHPAASR